MEGSSNEEIEIARKLASDYVAGGYRHDPNLHKNAGGTAVGIYITDANEIFDSEYRKHYYESPSLTQELVVLANVRGTLYYTSFYRKNGERAFGETEVTAMRAVAGFMVKTLHRHS